MIKHFKTSLLALLLGFSFYTGAAPWGKAHLQQAEKTAVQSINQFIQQNKASPLYRLLSDKEQSRLRQVMQFSVPSSPSFASMDNKTEVLVEILDDAGGEQKIAYAALLLTHSDASVYNSNALYLYEQILRYDNDGSVFAFKQLDNLNLPPDSKQAERREKLHRDYGFHLEDISVESTQETPEICLNFNQRVRGEPGQNWQKFIYITPKPDGDLGYRGDKLCFFGTWQTRYQINVKGQLQNEYQLTLAEDSSEISNTGMRPPMVRFAAGGSVLDAADSRYLAVDSANVDQVSVKLWQIPANNLSNTRVQSILTEPQDISSWRLLSILKREGQNLFSGTFTVEEKALNQTVTSNIFLDDLIADKPAKAGIFVITAVNADRPDDEVSALAFSLSNAGFSAYVTGEGLWAELRDLQTAQPISAEKVTLYAQNNTVLASAETDGKGVAYFAKPLISGKDGLRADHIISQSGDYFAYANIIDKPVDLSDKGLSGRIENAPLRSWIWADRGIYRPNDTANVMWLLKTPEGKAFNDAPVWLELRRPDGKVLLERLVRADASGAYRFSHYFANNARQGSWQLRLSLGKDGALLASKDLPVAAITPQQIEVNIKPLSKPLTANSTAQLGVQADWLYGAPAAGLSANISRTLQATALTQSDWQNWQVGLHDEDSINEYQDEEVQTTSADGSAVFAIKLGELPLSSKPLQLEVTARVDEPGGQQVKAKQALPIARQLPYVVMQAKGEKNVDVALLDGNGVLQAGTAKWQLYRVNYDYYWYQSDGQWQYRHNETRQLFKSGSVKFDGKKVERLKLPLDDGAWVLVVRGNSPAVAGSIPLEYGQYFSPSADNAPDKIGISSDKERYGDGEAVTLHLQAPFDGRASIKLALNDRIIDNRLLEFDEGKATLKLTWDSAWDDGLWLLANAWNGDQKNSHNRRAIGLHWLGGDLAPHRVDLTMDLPKTTRPDTTLKLPLNIPSEQADSPTWVQVAVVDDGLYRLAKPSFSNPLLAFFAKRQLNLAFFDVWGQIIRQVKARKVSLRSGSDDDASEDLSALKALPELDLQLLTFWSKPVQFDADGKALVEVDIPQFNGRLRVMAAAWNDDRLGAVEKTVTVKAPLVANLYTPPYLSPGDSSRLRLRLHNTTDKAMTVDVAIEAKGVDLSASKKQTLTLEPDQEQWLQRQFNVADNAGKNNTGRVQFAVDISGGQSIQLSRFADVRPRAYPLKSQQLSVLAAGEEKSLAVGQAGDLLSRHLFISTQAPFDPGNVVKQLSVYPYGCTEQITSKAGSNLLLPKLLLQYHLPDKTLADADEREKYLFAIQSQMANRQAPNGGFSLWGYGDSEVWLTAYVTEFLLNAQQANQLGNNLMLQRALAYLRSMVMSDAGDSASQAYAYYVLAKAGASVHGATIRFAEGRLKQDDLPKLSTPMLQTVAALVAHGELLLAERLMDTLIEQGIDSEAYDRYGHYGAGLRNYAQSLNVLYQLQQQLESLGVSGKLKEATTQALERLWPAMRQALANRSDYSTQALYWLSALASRLPVNDGTAKVVVDGKTLTIGKNRLLAVDKAKTVNVKNLSGSPIYLTQSTWLLPTGDEKQENGYTVNMSYQDIEGNPVDITRLKVNQQVLAIAEITMQRQHNADVLFVYPLPAGVASIALAQDFADKADRPWFDKLAQPSFSEDRDDRHLAAFNIGDDSGENTVFTHVFMLRAARQGVWHAPAYGVEEMYQPEYRAVYPSPTVTVKP
ncbi:MAG: hypothetical protein CR975_03825 [Gammaproteobacteria bacterium]|nr:MAG: hypothetical protein CR975_03825 [Gammaproteobacteria bacterium]